MTAVVRMLGLGPDRWLRGAGSLHTAAALVISSSTLMALNRFGGLVVDTPRAFTRVTLVGVYGWIGLAIAIAAGARLAKVPGNTAKALTVAGLSHLPLLALSLAVYAAGNLFRFLGPGTVVAVIAFAAWMPASIIVGARHVYGISHRRAAAITAGPYLLWLVTAGRYLTTQVQHLL